MVEKIRPVAPTLAEMKVAVLRETEDDLSVLKEILSQKLGRAATLADVIKWAAKVCREKHDPVAKAKRAVSSGRRSTTGTPRPGRHPIPALVKHEVVLQEAMRCSYVSPDGRRCEQKRWMHFHHRKEVCRGGSNAVENITLLCSRHHRLVHEGNAARG